jgi:preprotein translocase subunit SecG
MRFLSKMKFILQMKDVSMMPVLFGTFLHFVLGSLLLMTSIFLILLILVQRGRGGGLTGALGGMGGQSAFGTKAGDLFTRVTIVVASIWILLCLLTIGVLNGRSGFGRASNDRTGDANERLDANDQTNGDSSSDGMTDTGESDTQDGTD